MQATKSIISVYNAPGTTGAGEQTVVRPPSTLLCVRATFIAWAHANTAAALHISTAVVLPPGTDVNYKTVNQFVLDRRGVGYMQDEFYLEGKGRLVVIWEGIIQQ
jgi:hypothetical protein